MKRRFSTRTASLTARMALTLVLVLGLYAATAAGVVTLIWVEPGWAVYVIVIAVLLVGYTVFHVRDSGSLLLRWTGAFQASDDERGHVRSSLERVAALADIETPALWLIESDTPNAFAIGYRHGSSRVVVTTSLLDVLDDEELEAVLAHELAHIANRDAAVMTFASTPRAIGENLIGADSNLFFAWFFVWPLGLPLWAIGSLLTLTLSRYREFAADRGSALLTGRPASLMSALQKLDRSSRIPNRDLRGIGAVEALCIVPTGTTRLTLLRDHPPLDQRLARLAALARELGRPVA